GVQSISICGVFPQHVHEPAHQSGGNMIHAIVIVAKLWKVALDLIVRHQSSLVPQDTNPGITYGRQTVGDDRHAGHSKGHRSKRIVVVQGHFDTFVGVLVVHVVDDVHRVHVNPGEPFHHRLEPAEDVVKIQVVAHDASKGGSHLFSGEFIPASVDCVQQTLGHVRPGPEKLHL